MTITVLSFHSMNCILLKVLTWTTLLIFAWDSIATILLTFKKTSKIYKEKARTEHVEHLQQPLTCVLWNILR